MGDVEADALHAAATHLQPRYVDRVLAVVTDVGSQRDVEALAAAAADRFGGVHLLCNNAGVTGAGGPMWQLDARDWQWALGVNLWGVVHGIRAFVPGMIERGRGHVLNVSSLSGLTAPPFTAPYNATKHAVVALSETLAGELAMAGPGVGVSVACPGLVATAIYSAERNRPQELAHQPPPPHPVYEEFVRMFSGLAGEASDADEVALSMLHGVERGDLYVTTHPHMHRFALDRIDRLRAALISADAVEADA
jgi:NAD(P)-dependent dehydrogenase (short-subunit alcohol dehydrogenase family)